MVSRRLSPGKQQVLPRAEETPRLVQVRARSPAGRAVGRRRRKRRPPAFPAAGSKSICPNQTCAGHDFPPGFTPGSLRQPGCSREPSRHRVSAGSAPTGGAPSRGRETDKAERKRRSRGGRNCADHIWRFLRAFFSTSESQKRSFLLTRCWGCATETAVSSPLGSLAVPGRPVLGPGQPRSGSCV